MKKITFALIALFALSGCASKIPQNLIGGTHPYDTRPTEELTMMNESMYRGFVYLVAPEEQLQEMIAAYDGNEKLFQRAWGMSFAEAAKRDYVIVHWYRGLGGGFAMKNEMFLPKKEWNLQPGDIVDFLPDRGPVKVYAGEDVPMLCWAIGFWDVCRTHRIPLVEKPGVVLGVVCRDDEPGCSYDSSPETTIGIGRRMLSAAEYRGVEAESQQPMTQDGLTFAEWWNVPVCQNCADGEKPTIAE